MATLKERVTKAIRSLGSTRQEVYRTLRKAKIRGIQCSPGCCPIANYVRKEAKVAFGTNLRVATTWVDYGNNHLPLPNAVADFVNKFDDGGYPSLLEK